MPPSTLGAAAAVLALLVWLLRRRRPVVVLRSTDASAVAALNRSQMEAVVLPADAEAAGAGNGFGAQPGAPETGPALRSGVPLPAVPPPGAGELQRLRWLQALDQHFRRGGPDRLFAIGAAVRSGDRRVLPLLRQGLRDPDLAVMAEAARGMERFRGRGVSPQPAAPRPPLPRNVARTR